MAHIFITGSADGLGRAAAETLLGDGHEVIIHARSADRLANINALIARGASAVVGDLAELDQTRAVADQVNRLGPVDAVIHNAGVLSGPHLLPVNVVAPYLLTALIRAERLVYLSSDMHHGGRADIAGLDWSGRVRPAPTPTASCSSPPSLSRWLGSGRDVYSNAVDPGWVPTRMGGPGAPDDLRLGHLTQEWLATSDEPEARTSGGYWFHKRRRSPHPAALDPRFQDDLFAALARFTGAPLT